jgi:hypothetical protein
MKQRVLLVSVALVIGAGCGGGSGLDKEQKVCAHVDKLCGGAPEPLDKCARDLRERPDCFALEKCISDMWFSLR